MPMSPRLLRPRQTGFNPRSIASLQLWIEPSSDRVFSDSSATTAAKNGDGVAVVSSRVGTNITQTTQANRPTLITNARAGRPCLRFDGLNDSMAFSTTITQALGQHFFAVVDTTNIQTDIVARVMLDRTSATASNLALYLKIGTGSFPQAPYVYWGATRATWGASIQRAAVIRWTFDASSTAVQVDSASPVTGAAGSALTSWASVGNSSVQQPAFDLYECLLFSSLNAAEINRVTDYMMKKYAIA